MTVEKAFLFCVIVGIFAVSILMILWIAAIIVEAVPDFLASVRKARKALAEFEEER